MKQLSLICDRCGCVAEELQEISVRVKIRHLMEGNLYLSDSGDVKQLCNKCTVDLYKFLDGESL